MYDAIKSARQRHEKRIEVAEQILKDIKKLNEQESINEHHKDEYRTGLDSVQGRRSYPIDNMGEDFEQT